MTETEVRTQAVTADAAEFLRALGNAALFAGTDVTLPVLCAVHLRAVDGTLVAESTDRYAACQHMIRSATGDLDDGLLLWGKDVTTTVKRLSREVRAATDRRLKLLLTLSYAEGAREAVLTLGEETRLLCALTVGVPDIGGSSWPAKPVDRLWASHGKRLAKLDGNPYSRRFVINRKHLARLAAVQVSEQGTGYDHAQMQFTTTGKPVQVTIGSEFRAMISPVTGG
jgi:hypothetical protein